MRVGSCADACDTVVRIDSVIESDCYNPVGQLSEGPVRRNEVPDHHQLCEERV